MSQPIKVWRYSVQTVSSSNSPREPRARLVTVTEFARLHTFVPTKLKHLMLNASD
jgi:hypothetical protein